MASASSHRDFRRCSLCSVSFVYPSSAVLLRSNFTGWHRTYRLCSACTKMWEKLFQELKRAVSQ